MDENYGLTYYWLYVTLVAQGNESEAFESLMKWLREADEATIPSYRAAYQAYLQLLTATNPEANVVVASVVEPYASQGGSESLITILKAEMRQSAVPWVAGPRHF